MKFVDEEKCIDLAGINSKKVLQKMTIKQRLNFRPKTISRGKINCSLMDVTCATAQNYAQFLRKFMILSFSHMDHKSIIPLITIIFR